MRSLPTSWKYLLFLLLLVAVTIWTSFFVFPKKNLRIVACDVGQGDAILVLYKDKQILIDGGPDNKVTRCLDDNMAFWDRKIEVVILTHPQTDHFRGLIEVLKNYQVEMLVNSGLDSGSQEYKVLKEVVGGSGVEVVNATSDNVVRLGLLHFDILHPSSDFLALKSHKIDDTSEIGVGQVLGSFATSMNTNDLSLVGVLRFKEFDALFTGDIGPGVSDNVVEVLGQRGYGTFCTGECRDIEYIKIPHHGSKNGLTRKLLVASSPQVAVISAGENNRYGHPHQEVTKLLSDYDLKVLRTDEIGDVEIITDGERVWIKN